MMTKKQSEVAAEAYAASILARCGYDLFVQYGSNTPRHDIVANKGQCTLLISVKGNQDGGWPVALKFKKGKTGVQAADEWWKSQSAETVFVFVQFDEVPLASAPRVFVARRDEVRDQLKSQKNGKGSSILFERHRYGTIPATWTFTQARIDAI